VGRYKTCTLHIETFILETLVFDLNQYTYSPMLSPILCIKS
jgi:hypothetical protein